jgi:predicted lactoylglutathione lyase
MRSSNWRGLTLNAPSPAKSEAQADAFYAAAISAGATDNAKPSFRLYYDPRYYAANVLDPDGYSIEVVYKSWQLPQP